MNDEAYYINMKLAEAEEIANNSSAWISVDELFKEWDSWELKTEN